MTELVDDTDAVANGDEEITTTVDAGTHEASISIRVQDEDSIISNDNEVPIAGMINGCVYKGVLKRVKPRATGEDGGYVVKFDSRNGVSISGRVGDVTFSRVSSVSIDDETGDTIFTALGKDDIGSVRSNSIRNRIHD